MITSQNITRHEIIGKKVKVMDSTDPSHVGIEGTIIDETKNMLVMKCLSRVLTIPKKEVIIKIDIGTPVVVAGRDLVGRPEDRIKRKKKWT